MRGLLLMRAGACAAALLAAPAWAHHQHDHDEAAAPPAVAAPTPAPPIPAPVVEPSEILLPPPQPLPGGGLLQASVRAQRLEAMVTVTGDRPAAEMDPALPVDVAVRVVSAADALSGERRAFTVFSFGRPLGGAQVTLSTQAGWRKTLVSGDTGDVIFTLPRSGAAGLAVAEIQADAATGGTWQGQPFVRAHLRASWAGEIAPAPGGMLFPALAVAAALLAGGLVLRYRRRP